MEERGKSTRVHLQVSNLEWIMRAVLSNAPGITVISPESLVIEIKETAGDLLALY